MKNTKKTKGKILYSRNIENIVEKQQIAIERFGPIFQDEVFFELEMKSNSDLAMLIDTEFIKRNRKKKNLN